MGHEVFRCGCKLTESENLSGNLEIREGTGGLRSWSCSCSWWWFSCWGLGFSISSSRESKHEKQPIPLSSLITHTQSKPAHLPKTDSWMFFLQSIIYGFARTNRILLYRLVFPLERLGPYLTCDWDWERTACPKQPGAFGLIRTGSKSTYYYSF